MTMYANTGFPHHVHWSSDELADAVPRRLSELFHLESLAAAAAEDGAGAEARRARNLPRPYVPASTFPELFRVD